MRILKAGEYIQQYGQDNYRELIQSSPEVLAVNKPNTFERIKNTINQAGSNVADAISGQGEYEGQSNIRRATAAVASAFNAVPQVAVDVLPEPARKGVEAVGKTAVKAIDWLGDKLGSTELAQNFVTKHPEAAKTLEEIAGTASNLGQIAGDILVADQGAKAMQKGTGLAKQGATITKDKAIRTVNATKQKVPELIAKGKEILEPKPPSPKDAVRQVLQGEVADVKDSIRGLKAVDTKGVKTYNELSTKVTDTIAKLSKKVDDVLDKDKTPTKLGKLIAEEKTKAGQVVKVNYVDRAMKHLKELYSKTGDDVSAKNMQDLIKLAKTKGLTKKQVNDLARQYGAEFGEKAFGKTGDPLTSINAQKFENTRTGLKNIARQGLEGSVAKATDKTISSLYKVQELVKKNAEAVNKLSQKIQERGILEKFGYKVAKTADILSGGSLRGIMGGILPRGVGYKVMNALDLEQVLQRNLDIIKKALKSGTDKELMDLLKKTNR